MPPGTSVRRLLGHRVCISLCDSIIRVMVPLGEEMFKPDQLAIWKHIGDDLPGAEVVLIMTYQYRPVAAIVLDSQHQTDADADAVIHGLAAKFGRDATIIDGPPPPPKYVHFHVRLPAGATGREIANLETDVLGMLSRYPRHDPGE